MVEEGNLNPIYFSAGKSNNEVEQENGGEPDTLAATMPSLETYLIDSAKDQEHQLETSLSKETCELVMAPSNLEYKERRKRRSLIMRAKRKTQEKK